MEKITLDDSKIILILAILEKKTIGRMNEKEKSTIHDWNNLQNEVITAVGSYHYNFMIIPVTNLSRDTGTVIISNQLYKFKLEFWLSHIQLN
jgi:hypothetical protein